MTRRISLVAVACSFVVLLIALFGADFQRGGEARVRPADAIVMRSVAGASGGGAAVASLPATSEKAGRSAPAPDWATRHPISLPGSSAVAAPMHVAETAQLHSARDPADKVSMGAAERLSIKFQGFPDLNGEYRVSADGSITIPVIGRIPVAGLADAELEAVLAQRLAKTTARREAYVTVEVSEYRPVFVTGYVARPGSFSWKPGINVLQAVALAGGMFRTRGENGIVLTEDTELAKLQRSVSDQKRQLATLARLRAEIANARDIAVPKKLVDVAGSEEAMTLIAAETVVFESRRASLEAQRAALARGLEAARKEVKSLGEQSGRAKALLDRRRDYKEQIDRLQSKGIIRADRSMEEMSRVSDLEDRGSLINVSLARVQVMIAGLERDSIMLEQGRKADLDAEAIKLERALAQLDIDIESARQTYRKMTGQDPPNTVVSSEGPKKLSLQYEIVRSRVGTAERIAADPLQILKPGDTLVVSAD